MPLIVSSFFRLSLCVLLVGNQRLIALPSLTIADAELLGETTITAIVEKPVPTQAMTEKPTPYQPTAEDYFNGTNGVVQNYAKASESIIKNIDFLKKDKDEVGRNWDTYRTLESWVKKFESHPELAAYTEQLLLIAVEKSKAFKAVGPAQSLQLHLADFYQMRHSLHNEQKSLAALQKALSLTSDILHRESYNYKQADTASKIAYLYERQGNYAQALQYYEIALNLSGAYDLNPAREGLGRIYFLGLGVEKDYAKAYDYLRRHIKQAAIRCRFNEASPSAKYYLGTLYLNGWGTAKDLTKAYALFKLSAKTKIVDPLWVYHDPAVSEALQQSVKNVEILMKQQPAAIKKANNFVLQYEASESHRFGLDGEPTWLLNKEELAERRKNTLKKTGEFIVAPVAPLLWLFTGD